MKVGILHVTHDVAMGGGERVLLSLIDGFKREGWGVKLVMWTGTDSPTYDDVTKYFESGARPDQIVSFAFPEDGLLSSLRRYFTYRKIAREFEGCDAVVRLSGYPWFSSFIKARSYCYVQTFPTTPQRLRSKDSGSLVGRLLLGGLYKRSGSNVRFVAVSKYVKEGVESVWKQPSIVIPPPVDSEHFRGLAQKYNGKRIRRRIVSIGRFAQSKNHVEQLEIISSLARKETGWSLSMVGSATDPKSKMIVEQLSKSLDQRGIKGSASIFVSSSAKETDAELGTAEYLLHTGQREGFGIVIAEAVYAGCIPVVPRMGGAAELVSKDLQFSSVEEAVGIFERLATGWRPASVFTEEIDYGEGAFQNRWIQLLSPR